MTTSVWDRTKSSAHCARKTNPHEGHFFCPISRPPRNLKAVQSPCPAVRSVAHYIRVAHFTSRSRNTVSIRRAAAEAEMERGLHFGLASAAADGDGSPRPRTLEVGFACSLKGNHPLDKPGAFHNPDGSGDAGKQVSCRIVVGHSMFDLPARFLCSPGHTNRSGFCELATDQACDTKLICPP
jgi:hypothetical protein